MRTLQSIAVLLAVLALPVAGHAGSEPTTSAGTPELTTADVNSWLDGMMPYALQTGDIAGAVVVVVKDGHVLTQRGFGYSDMKTQQPVDPDQTLFRPGSTSKLFTWTAVMQQVQAGRLDLDRDINDYLDFKIPPAFGQPVTLRHLMTHTAGFEEAVKYLIMDRPADLPTLGATLRRWVPERIYAPGAMAAYSNYGASLAGYIVQRVSGEPFEQYVQRHIMEPLGMQHSSFVQPLPAALAAGMSRGYSLSSQAPEPFELVVLAPAGALAATGADMGRFMIAHLTHDGPLLNSQTAELMYRTANTPIPGLPGMALGFYHEDRNGLNIVGHGGDTQWFHSDLHLYLDKGVGLFVSYNSAGKQGAADVARERLFSGFTDRYFPLAPEQLPTLATARAHGSAMVGHYLSSRSSSSNWLRIVMLLSGTKVSLNDDDTITVPALLNAAGVPKRWREVAPWQWREVGGAGRLAAVVKDGRVTAFSMGEYAAIIDFLPATAAMNAGWILPVLVTAVAIVLLTSLAWPIVALVRRRYGYRPAISGRALQLQRATRITACLMLVIVGGWGGMILALDNISLLDGRLDIWMRLLQLVSLLAIAGTTLSVWNAYALVRSPETRRLQAIWAVLFALAALFLVWLIIIMRTLTPALNY